MKVKPALKVRAIAAEVRLAALDNRLNKADDQCVYLDHRLDAFIRMSHWQRFLWLIGRRH